MKRTNFDSVVRRSGEDATCREEADAADDVCHRQRMVREGAVRGGKLGLKRIVEQSAIESVSGLVRAGPGGRTLLLTTH